MASKANYGATLLMKQLGALNKDPNESFSVGMADDNIFKWNVLIVGPPDSMYEGGFFKAVLDFPDDFPNSPPVMTFTSTMFHPNIYPDGKVCISILHPPGEDKFNEFESATERWQQPLGCLSGHSDGLQGSSEMGPVEVYRYIQSYLVQL